MIQFCRNKKALSHNSLLTISATVIIMICLSVIFVGIKISALQDENNQLKQDIANLQSSINSSYILKTNMSQQFTSKVNEQIAIINAEAVSALGQAKAWCQNLGDEAILVLSMSLEDSTTKEIYNLALTDVKQVQLIVDSETYIINAVPMYPKELTICNGTGNFIIDPTMLPTVSRIILMTTNGIIVSPYFTLKI